MNFVAFSILDTKTGLFQPPFFMAHPGQAIRAFEDLANDQNTNIGRHPSDFILTQVGAFDDNLGQMQPQTPLHLVTALTLIKQPAEVLPFERIVTEQHVGANGRS